MAKIQRKKHFLFPKIFTVLYAKKGPAFIGLLNNEIEKKAVDMMIPVRLRILRPNSILFHISFTVVKSLYRFVLLGFMAYQPFYVI